MPSETERILQAYHNSQVIEEAPITPGSSVYDRAAVGAQKFITGHGGGISQLAGKAVGWVGGAKNMAAMSSKFKEEDTANWLYNHLVPILRRHNNNITVKQLKDALSKIPIVKGGPNIKPDELQALKQYPDVNAVIENESLLQILKLISSELQEMGLTGKGALTSPEEVVKYLEMNGPIITAACLQWLTIQGLIPVPPPLPPPPVAPAAP